MDLLIFHDFIKVMLMTSHTSVSGGSVRRNTSNTDSNDTAALPGFGDV